MKPLSKAIQILGTQAELARCLGVAPQVVNNWRQRGNVPAEYAPLIEKATKGKVKANDVTPAVPWDAIRRIS